MFLAFTFMVLGCHGGPISGVGNPPTDSDLLDKPVEFVAAVPVLFPHRPSPPTTRSPWPSQVAYLREQFAHVDEVESSGWGPASACGQSSCSGVLDCRVQGHA